MLFGHLRWRQKITASELFSESACIRIMRSLFVELKSVAGLALMGRELMMVALSLITTLLLSGVIRCMYLIMAHICVTLASARVHTRVTRAA